MERCDLDKKVTFVNLGNIEINKQTSKVYITEHFTRNFRGAAGTFNNFLAQIKMRIDTLFVHSTTETDYQGFYLEFFLKN